MNYTRLLVSLTAVFVATAPVVRAQLVHIKFSEPDNITIFHADTANIPLDRAAGPMSELDLFYRPQTAVWDAGNSAWVTNGPGNFWRARYDIGGIGTFIVTRPIDHLELTWSGIQFDYFNSSGAYESMDFRAVFDGGILGAGPYPTWPLPPLIPKTEFGGSYFFFDAAGSYFGVPHLNEGYAYGAFREATMYPIPEPATCGAAAAALLIGLVWLRRRDRANPPHRAALR